MIRHCIDPPVWLNLKTKKEQILSINHCISQIWPLAFFSILAIKIAVPARFSVDWGYTLKFLEADEGHPNESL